MATFVVVFLFFPLCAIAMAVCKHLVKIVLWHYDFMSFGVYLFLFMMPISVLEYLGLGLHSTVLYSAIHRTYSYPANTCTTSQGI